MMKNWAELQYKDELQKDVRLLISEKLKLNNEVAKLTPDQIDIKNTYLSNEKLKERTKLNKQLVEIQEKIKENQKLDKQLVEIQEQINKIDCEK